MLLFLLPTVEKHIMDTHSHEHLLQMLSSMLIQLNALQASVGNDKGVDETALRNGLATLEQLTREMLYEVRSANEDLPLAELEGVSLPEALSRAIEETAEALGLSSRVQFSGEERSLPKSIERLLYSIAREALFQVQQHTGTRKLRLSFNYGREGAQMSIEDDGMLPVRSVNINAEAPAPPFNIPDENIPAPPFTEKGEAPSFVAPVINDLRQRIERLGGSLEITLQGEQGTRFQARVPYVHHDAAIQSNTPDAGAQYLPRPSLKSSPDSSLHLPIAPVSTPPHVRVLIVDNQAVTRAGLRRLLESYPDLQVVGAAADGVQAVSETLELGPQVVLMDMQLPNGQSLEALRQIKQLNLDTHVLLLSAQDREEFLYETLRAGADGYVLKDIAPDELAQAIRAVARGEVLVRAPTRSRVPARGTHIEALTAREEEVLRLLARGLRNKEIAARLYVSERTVNFHLANIYQKLNVSGRTEALSKALEQGIITA